MCFMHSVEHVTAICCIFVGKGSGLAVCISAHCLTVLRFSCDLRRWPGFSALLILEYPEHLVERGWSYPLSFSEGPASLTYSIPPNPWQHKNLTYPLLLSLQLLLDWRVTPVPEKTDGRLLL